MRRADPSLAVGSAAVTAEVSKLACENPASRSEFRMFNQMAGQMPVKDIAETARAAFPGDVTIGNLENFWSRRP